MVIDSARRGDNVGLDEFGDIGTTGDDIRKVEETMQTVLLDPSEVFVAHQKESCEPEAFIVIQPNTLTRFQFFSFVTKRRNLYSSLSHSTL
jgi:hypothetical protein